MLLWLRAGVDQNADLRLELMKLEVIVAKHDVELVTSVKAIRSLLALPEPRSRGIATPRPIGVAEKLSAFDLPQFLEQFELRGGAQQFRHGFGLTDFVEVTLQRFFGALLGFHRRCLVEVFGACRGVG